MAPSSLFYEQVHAFDRHRGKEPTWLPLHGGAHGEESEYDLATDDGRHDQRIDLQVQPENFVQRHGELLFLILCWTIVNFFFFLSWQRRH
jgi:hypothetical protein